jgi:hypothetical protein
MPSDVLDYVRERSPDLADVPDEELTLYVGDRAPELLQDEAFRNSYWSLRPQPSLKPVLPGPSRAETPEAPTPEEMERETPTADGRFYDQPTYGRRDSGYPKSETQAAAEWEAGRKELLDATGFDLPHQDESPGLATPALRTPKPTTADVQTLAPWLPKTAAAVIAGTERGASGFVDFFTSPLGWATLGTGGLPVGAQRAIALGFGVDMARHTPDNFKALAEGLREGDYEKAAEAATSGALQIYFGGKALKHGALGEKGLTAEEKAALIGKALFQQMDRPEFDLGRLADKGLIPAPEGLTPEGLDESSFRPSVGPNLPRPAPAEIAPAEEPAGMVRMAAEAPTEGVPQPPAPPEQITSTGAGSFAGSNDLIQALLDEGVTIRSKKGMRPGEEGYYGENYRAMAADPILKPLFSPDGEPMDSVVENLRRSGQLPEDATVDDFHEALQAAAENRRAMRSGAKGEAKALTEGLAEQKDFEGALSGERKYTAAKTDDLPSRELLVGDQVELDGEKVTVTNLHYDAETGELSGIEIEDGRRFGVKQMDPDGVVKVDKGTYQPKEAEFLGEEETKTANAGDAEPANAEEAARRVAERVNPTRTGIADPGVGISLFKGGKPPPMKLPVWAGKGVRSLDPAVEARWQGARASGPTFWEKVKEIPRNVYRSFTRQDIHLSPRDDAPVIDVLYQWKQTPRWAGEVAGQYLKGLTAGFDPDRLDLLSRNIILPDLYGDVMAGHYAGKDLPFGYKDAAAVKRDLDHYDAAARLNPEVMNALTARRQFMDALRLDLVQKELLPASVLQRKDYFHRQVMEHLNLKEYAGTGLSSPDVREHTKGFQRKRSHSSQDYNTSYLESEFEVVSQALTQLRTRETLQRVRALADISDHLKALGKAQGVDWRTLLPDNYVLWQPKEGNVFYRANTIGDRILQEVLAGTHQLKADDVGTGLMLGGKRLEWAIPKRLAKTLDDIKPNKDENVIGKASGAITQGWKYWQTRGPTRAAKFWLNNLSGDLDIALAADPGILNYLPKAFKESWDWRVSGKAPSPDQIAAVKKGIIGSGFYLNEIQDVSKHPEFRALAGQTNLGRAALDKYAGFIDSHNAWREDMLRLAAYRYYRDRLATGKPTYGASSAKAIDALIAETKAAKPSITLDDVAAKLARELIGDYGNVSQAGQWLRRHLIPFYSWMEINAPRYARLLRNAALEGNAGRTGVVGAALAAKNVGVASAKMGLLFYGAVQLWNHMVHPDEERDLGDERKQLHIILGRDEDGNIRTLRTQGAFSDALDWFAFQNAPDRIADIVHGKIGLKQLAMETLVAPVNKLLNASVPLTKMTIEAVSKHSTYPDPIKVVMTKDGPQFQMGGRMIRDPIEYLARGFSMGMVYNWALKGVGAVAPDMATPKPTRGWGADVGSLFSYTTNPGEAAYFAARTLVREKQAAIGKESFQAAPTDKANALYYYKQSVRFGDDALAQRWLDRYYKLGGTKDGIKDSIANTDPLASIPKRQRNSFYAQLNPEEQAIVGKAEEWYRRVYLHR